MIRAVAFDVMDTVVRDPFREALEAATGLPLDEVLRRRDPHVYPAFERADLDEAAYWESYARAGIAVDPQAFHRVRRERTRWLPGMGKLLDALEGTVVRATATNYPRWIDELARTTLAGRFDRIVASCDLGARKPGAGFYRGLLDALGLPAHEVLFVDDREENVTGAREVGITGHRFRSASEVRRWLADQGVRVTHDGAA